MDILVLTHHRIINNFNGAVVRIRSLALELSRQGANVTIVSFISPRLIPIPKQSPAHNLTLFEVTNFFQWLDGPTTKLGLPSYSLAAFLNKMVPLPFPAKLFFDLTISESPFLWQIARRIKGRLKVLSAHNYEFDYHSHFPPLALTLIKQNEIQAIREADLIISVSRENELSFRSINPDVPIHWIPNGFEKHNQKYFDRQQIRHYLSERFSLDPKKKWALLIASNSFHNLRGFESLYPVFLKSEVRNKWNLLVVGNLPISSSFARDIIFCGIQSDLSPFFIGSDLALNPVISGSGSNLKLIECLGNGLPVLTTPFGARGFKDKARGLYEVPLEDFETRLLSEKPLIKPEVEEIASFEWSRLGNQLYEIYRQCLNDRERTS